MNTPTWDTNTAAGAIIIGALALLFLIHRGFRGVTVTLGD